MKKLMFCVVVCATVFTACSKPADKGYQAVSYTHLTLPTILRV